jgi:hypothetical protein
MTKYLSILILLAFFSCTQDNQSFDIGGKYVNVQTDLRYIDTLTVNSFTVRLDSLRTSGLESGQGAVVVGKYHDPEIGDISASSYFKISLPDTRTVPTNSVYDSLVLIMVDNKYSIGDTLQPLTIHVHRVEETIKVRDDNYLYNTSKFAYGAVPLGSKTFKARPNNPSYDTVTVRLNDDLGNELLGFFINKDDRILQLDNWLSYFKGLTIQNDLSDEAVYGFSITTAVPVMRLYYHYFNYTNISQYRDFPILGSTVYQFNHFDITNPLIDLPTNQKDKLPVKYTHNQSYLQAGTGIITRLEIPFLKNLLVLHENMRILKAELTIEPARNTYKTITLPQRISLFQSDKYNRFGSPVLNLNTGSALIGTLIIDDVYQEDTRYTFDVTSFMQTKIAEATDDIPSLLVTVTPTEIYTTADRLILGSQSNSESKIKLKLYYMNY